MIVYVVYVDVHVYMQESVCKFIAHYVTYSGTRITSINTFIDQFHITRSRSCFTCHSSHTQNAFQTSLAVVFVGSIFLIHVNFCPPARHEA